MAVCLGQAIGTSGGGLAWDRLGFEGGMILEAVMIIIAMIVVVFLMNFNGKILLRANKDEETEAILLR